MFSSIYSVWAFIGALFVGIVLMLVIGLRLDSGVWRVILTVDSKGSERWRGLFLVS